jgi:hypothetical protein
MFNKILLIPDFSKICSELLIITYIPAVTLIKVLVIHLHYCLYSSVYLSGVAKSLVRLAVALQVLGSNFDFSTQQPSGTLRRYTAMRTN